MTSTLSTRHTPALLPADYGVSREDWRDVGPDFITAWGRPNGGWDPEHLTVYGKSGGGKSYFVCYVCRQRAAIRQSDIVMLSTKRQDKTMTGMGWPLIRSWPPGYGENQVVLRIPAKGLDPVHMLLQKRRVFDFMKQIWVPDSNLVVVWDELTYLETDLGLKRQLAMFYREGRGNGITNIATMQRPAGVTRLAHSEAGWTVAFPPKDVDDRDRVAEVLGDRLRFKVILDSLNRARHEFIMRHDLTGITFITSLPGPRQMGVSTRRSTGVRSRTR